MREVSKQYPQPVGTRPNTSATRSRRPLIGDFLSPMRATNSNDFIHHFHRDGVLGNSNQFHGIAPTPMVSGLSWHEQCVVRHWKAQTSCWRSSPPPTLRGAPAGGWPRPERQETALNIPGALDSSW